jgi:hypothetical protein
MNNTDILDRLQELANKWQWAQPEVRDVCKDAMYEIRLLREPKGTKHEYGSQGFSEGAD